MKRLLLLAMLALSGCATVEDVRNTHSSDLCYRVATGRFAGLSASVFYETLAARGEDCSQYRNMIAMRMQAQTQSNAAMSSGLLLLQAAQPRARPITPQTDVTCRTIPGPGGQYTTQCW